MWAAAFTDTNMCNVGLVGMSEDSWPFPTLTSTKYDENVILNVEGFKLPWIEESMDGKALLDEYTAMHAEMYAIYNASLTGVSLKGSTLYVYGLPICNECAKGIIQVGIRKVIATRPKIYNSEWDKSNKLAEELFSEAEVMYLIDVDDE